MDASYISIFSFIVVTCIYFFSGLKKRPTIEIISNKELYPKFIESNYLNLFIYFLAVVIIQFAINSFIIIQNCGGNAYKNIGSAALMTFIPWFLIFGLVIAILIMFPGFKSPFSNVIGYFAISGRANNILSELLENTEINNVIEEDASLKGNEEKKKAIQSAAEAILKLCGNISIYINQIVPSNFQEKWVELSPLFKEKYINNNDDMKQKLLDLVFLKDNIGEMCWYIYTAVFLISMIQYKLTKKGCAKDPAAMEEARKIYLDKQNEINDAKNKAQSTIYTL
jgi:hypothetical protein